MSGAIDTALLARYLDGTATAAERDAVEAWLGSSPERHAALAELRDAWVEDTTRLEAPYDADAAWQRLKVATSPRRRDAARWQRTARDRKSVV